MSYNNIHVFWGLFNSEVFVIASGFRYTEVPLYCHFGPNLVQNHALNLENCKGDFIPLWLGGILATPVQSSVVNVNSPIVTPLWEDFTLLQMFVFKAAEILVSM